MSKHDGESFKDNMEVLDGNEYHNCTFNNVVFVYKGGEIPVMKGCSINNCTIDFQDAAFRTINLLCNIYSGLPGGDAFIEEIFEQIRRGGR